MVELGDLAQCKITQLKGTVTNYAKCITGCDRVYIQPPIDKEGKARDGMWVDVQTVDVIKKAYVKVNEVRERGPKAKKGAPMSREK